ncbi:MAG: tetratricopeptide repeat protein [Lentisphaerae bacterium]|nr:tetratricopeptide repeat protein [Lentisphaerota bacterium]
MRHKTFFAWLVLAAGLLDLTGCREEPGLRDFQNGVRALEKKRYARSIEYFQQSAQARKNPVENAKACNFIGIAQYELGNKDKAVQAFNAGRQLNPAAMEPVYNLAVVLHENSDTAQATLLFEQAATLDPRDTRALEFLASVFRRSKRLDDARRVLNEALKRAPHSPRVLTAMALLEMQVNNMDKAGAYLNQALESNAGYVPAIYNLAVLNQAWLNNREQALAYYKAALRRPCESPYLENARDAVKKLSAASAPPVSNTPPVAAKTAGRPAPPPIVPPKPPEPIKAEPLSSEKTVAAFADIMKNAKALAVSGRKDAALTFFLQAASDAERNNQPARQEEALREALNWCPDEARAHFAMGQFMQNRKQNEPALKHYKQAVALSNTWYEAHMALASVAIETDEFDTALISLQQASQTQPGNPDALWQLARFYDKQVNRPEDAAKAYTQFKQRFPQDPRADSADQRLAALSAYLPKPPAVSSSKPSAKPADGRGANASPSFLRKWRKSPSTSSSNRPPSRTD